MIKIPINKTNYPIYLAGIGVIVILLGISHLEGAHLGNSIYNATMKNIYDTESESKIFDTSGADLYFQTGTGLLILSALAYFLPKIIHF